MKYIIDNRHPYIFIAPAVILLVLFSILPLIIAFFISFTDMDLVGLADFSKINFNGIKNYLNIIKDPVFIKSIQNTLFFVFTGVPTVVALSLTLALIIDFGETKIFQFFRALFYMPSVTNVVAVAVVFLYLYNPQFGLFNHILSIFGIPPVGWLSHPTTAKISLVILAVWRGIGMNMIIFLAAIKGIPKTYYEAAQLDGAGAFAQLFKITIPLLSYSTFFIILTTLIGWLQFFDEPFVMTEGKPLDGTTSVALFIYRNGFRLNNFGYAAAGSVILFIAILSITVVQLKFQNKDNY